MIFYKYRIMSENPDIYRIFLPNQREIILVGTAHISQESKDLVKKTIEEEAPDTVCVELDEGRMKSLEEPNRWKSLDLKAIIKEKLMCT